jgi:hypothetical protein
MKLQYFMQSAISLRIPWDQPDTVGIYSLAGRKPGRIALQNP